MGQVGPEKGKVVSPGGRGQSDPVSLFRDPWGAVLWGEENGVQHWVLDPIRLMCLSLISPLCFLWLPWGFKCGHGNWKQI